MDKCSEDFNELIAATQRMHHQHKMVLSFWDYLELVRRHPAQFLRNSSQYLAAMFEHYGTHPTHELCTSAKKFKLFEMITPERVAVIGGEGVQHQIMDTLRAFITYGHSFKLLLLHGPNGSSKSTTVAAITGAMEDYSHTDEGAIYKFSWIFSQDRQLHSPALDRSTSIGFADAGATHGRHDLPSLAGLDEAKISAKINSEFRENPIYLLPMPLRQQFLSSLQYSQDKASETGQTDPLAAIPEHIWLKGLSKKNKDIFDHLLAAYQGDLRGVLRHVQVERFYLSRHYRHGIATVEPQMSIDATERQLTMDHYIKELPSVLKSMNFFDYSGPLVEGNRGLIEFSDFLKRPLETFKYLLNTIELRSVQLTSATALLDTVFVATTNDKHWEAFASLPDFNSFRGRIHLITVPYLLDVHQEMQIYTKDCIRLERSITIAPHTLKILCLFAVMTRLRPPALDDFDAKHSPTLKRLNPLLKAALYNGDLQQLHHPTGLTKTQQQELAQLTLKLKQQFINHPHYEGKYGVSPRLVRDMLHGASRQAEQGHLSVVDILETITQLITRDDMYEFLRREAEGSYHNPAECLSLLRQEYQAIFEDELLESMAMAESQQYHQLLHKYVHHVVTSMRQEKLIDAPTATPQEPSEDFMKSVEATLNVSARHLEFRESLLTRLASYKIDHPDSSIQLEQLFDDLLHQIKQHYYRSKQPQISALCHNILHTAMHPDDPLPADAAANVERTLHHLHHDYGYHQVAVVRSLQMCLSQTQSKLKHTEQA